MQKQHGHPDGIRPYDVTGASNEDAGTVAQQQIAGLVGVPRPPPPAAAEEQARVLAAVRGLVGSCQKPGRFAPDEAAPSKSAEAVLLVVDSAEDKVACDLQSKDDGEIRRGGRGRVQAQVLALDSVGGRQEAKATSGEIKAVIVVGDVDGAQIPRIVDEKVNYIDDLQDGEEHQRRCNVTECLVLVCHVEGIAAGMM